MKNLFIQKMRERYFSLDIENKIGRNIFFWRVILITVLYLVIIPLVSFIGLIFKFGDIFAFIFGDFFSGLLFLSFFVSTVGKLTYYSSLIFLFRKRTNDTGLQGNFSRNLIFIHFIFSILSSVLFFGYMAGIPGILYPIGYFFWQQLLMVFVVFYGMLFNGFDLTSIMPIILNRVNLIMLIIITSYITGGTILIQYIKMSLIKGKSEF